MSHVADQVVAALVAALVAGVPAVGGRVFDSRVEPLAPDELPAIVVFEGGEEIRYPEIVEGDNRRQIRSQRVQIHLIESALSGVVADIRARRLDAERVLAADLTIGGLARDSRLLSVSAPRIDEAVEDPVAITTLLFEAEVWTLEQSPDVAL